MPHPVQAPAGTKTRIRMQVPLSASDTGLRPLSDEYLKAYDAVNRSVASALYFRAGSPRWARARSPAWGHLLSCLWKSATVRDLVQEWVHRDGYLSTLLGRDKDGLITALARAGGGTRYGTTGRVSVVAAATTPLGGLDAAAVRQGAGFGVGGLAFGEHYGKPGAILDS